MTTITQTLGDIAETIPSAKRVFLRHELDFCCGGARTLETACTRAGLDAEAIAREIDDTAGRGGVTKSWQVRPLDELTVHIESHYHQALRNDVPALIQAAIRVEKVHAGKPNVPVGLADTLACFWDEMLGHMNKEETILFPMIRRGARGESVYMPVRVMEEEHDQHAESLARLRELTGNYQVPENACGTWRALYEGLATLQAELMDHIHLENNVLFLRAVRGD